MQESTHGDKINELAAVADLLTGPQLGALARLDHAIDRHLAGLDFGMRETARMTQPRRLEQLVELDMSPRTSTTIDIKPFQSAKGGKP